MPSPTRDQERANQRNAVLSGFLGWTLDAFDFFVLIFVVSAIAKDFGKSIPAIALTITASLAMRPVGAFTFGVLAAGSHMTPGAAPTTAKASPHVVELLPPIDAKAQPQR